MSLISLILALAIAGFICWIILQIPMPAVFKNIILGIICLFLVIWVLQSLRIVTGIVPLRLR